jgi:hypothetical protein
MGAKLSHPGRSVQTALGTTFVVDAAYPSSGIDQRVAHNACSLRRPAAMVFGYDSSVGRNAAKILICISAGPTRRSRRKWS